LKVKSNNILKVELVLFIKNCIRRRSILLPSLKFYSKFFVLNIKKRVFKRPNINYPQRIIELYSYSQNYRIQYVLKPSNFQEIDFVFTTPLISIDKNINKWKLEETDFKDEEIINSMHRCYWFFYDYNKLDKIVIADLNNLIKAWIFENQYQYNDVAWHPYTSTERVMSYCISFLLKEPFSKLKDSIVNDNVIRSLFNNTIINNLKSLEYYPSGISYNHVVNDLRGVLASAILLDDEKLKMETFKQLIFELNLILDDDGILREGSSHYHLIITRWILEMECFLCESGEIELVSILKTYTTKMLKGVNFFISGLSINSMPLFGDISPDLDPEWILRYFKELLNTHSGSKTYATMLKSRIDIGQRISNESDTLSLSNYTRISKGDWIVFIKHQFSRGEFFPNHSHDDNFNIIVYFKGERLIIDPGRDSYLLPPTKNVFCSSESHNIRVINGISLDMPESLKYYFPYVYYKSEFKKEMISDTELKFKISTNSVRRALNDNDSNFNREVIVNDESITINDYIESSCTAKIDIEYKLCFGPTCKFVEGQENDITINMSGSDFKLYTYSKTDRIESEKYCLSYNNVGDTVAAKWSSLERIKSFKLKIA
jgi:hypothetical protein